MTAQQQETIFRRWLDEHIGLMLKVVRGCAASPPDQDDLLQEVLLQTWSSIPAFRGEAKETTWIYRVAWNTALAWRRGERRRREGHETFIKFSPSPRVQPDGLSYQEMAEVLGISENYIGVKLNRIRKQLADQLKGASNEL
jgi:RNA polymerase sigma-70 factor (ECF subfamily)